MDYDVIIVGGGLGGASLAKNLVERGRSALVLERETRFKDRVRGEQMHPWGVAAARDLGIYNHLADTGGHQTRWWTSYFGGAPVTNRDLVETTPHRVGSFNFYHPDMQETLLQFAQDAGAEIRRGATVSSIVPGNPPRVDFQEDGEEKSLTARIVVGADGRNSRARAWGGFKVNRDPDRLVIAGCFLESTSVPDDAVHLVAGDGEVTLVAPVGKQRARVYFIYRKSDMMRPLSGDQQIAQFLSSCLGTGAPAEWFERARFTGPLAQFEGADNWVDHPARDSVVLIGDAAAATDPSWGSGLSLTLWDVRQLVDCISSTPDWNTAINDYAIEHDRYYDVLHRIENWMAELIWSTGEEADKRRARVLPRLLTDPEGAPDIVGLGPDSPSDEAARKRLIGWD